jgi:hypothetical protein
VRQHPPGRLAHYVVNTGIRPDPTVTQQVREVVRRIDTRTSPTRGWRRQRSQQKVSNPLARAGTTPLISRAGSTQRPAFGTKRSWVRIPPPRPATSPISWALCHPGASARRVALLTALQTGTGVGLFGPQDEASPESCKPGRAKRAASARNARSGSASTNGWWCARPAALTSRSYGDRASRHSRS